MNKKLCLIFFICLNSFASNLQLDAIAAVVDNEIITISDIKNAIFEEKTISNRNISESKALDLILEESILTQQAKKMNIDVTHEELSGLLKSFASNHNQTVESLSEILRQQNITISEFKNKLMRQMLSARVVVSLMPNNSRPSAEAVKTFWNKHKNDQIMLSFKDWQLTSKPENRAWQKQKPNLFPMTLLNSLPKEYQESISKQLFLKEYGPIKTSNGWHMVEVTNWQGVVMPENYAANVVMMQAIAKARPKIVATLRKNFYVKIYK